MESGYNYCDVAGRWPHKDWRFVDWFGQEKEANNELLGEISRDPNIGYGIKAAKKPLAYAIGSDDELAKKRYI